MDLRSPARYEVGISTGVRRRDGAEGKNVKRDDNIGDVPRFSTVTKSAVPMQCLHSR